jgi:hypothetical protein
MNQDEIDWLWKRVLREAGVNGEEGAKYRFAEIVAGFVRDACISACVAQMSGDKKMLYNNACLDCASAVKSLRINKVPTRR